jgi:DNA topoisomerase VI subunit B
MFCLALLQDNGVGMPHKDIPNLLGRVLSGTKYGVQQTRGKFGLGAKMALIWSKMSTGLPIEVWSAKMGQATISHFKLDIDIHKWVTTSLSMLSMPIQNCNTLHADMFL